MDWKDVVKKVAPWIGTALTGPLGGAAIGAIADALGVEEKTADAVKQAVLGASPEQLLLLKQADQSFALKMQELGFSHEKDMEALVVQDRANARGMAIATGDVWTPRLIAIAVVIGWMTIQIILVNTTVDAGMRELIARVLGTLDAALMVVLYYYFGGSRGSDRKTELMAQSQVAVPIASRGTAGPF